MPSGVCFLSFSVCSACGSACAGKMLGLHSGDGHVMWSLAFPQGQTPQQLFLWRSSHDLQKAPQVLALHSSETTSSYSIVDAHTGKEVSSGVVDMSVSQVMSIRSYRWWYLFLHMHSNMWWGLLTLEVELCACMVPCCSL